MEAIDAGWVSFQALLIDRFENSYHKFHGRALAVTRSNCTTALHIADTVAPGEEDICPDLTFIAPINMVTLVGAIPVFVDIEPNSFNIAPSKFEAAGGNVLKQSWRGVFSSRQYYGALGKRLMRPLNLEKQISIDALDGV